MATRTEVSAATREQPKSFWGRWFNWIPSWKPTSDSLLENAERSVLEDVTSKYQDSFVPVRDGAHIRTLSMEPDTQPHPPGKLPLVMLHGFGAGLLQFYKNFDGLHEDRSLHAMDLPGFARSSRVTFTPEAEAAEREYVELIEKWREGVGLEKFILLGHSFGAFLACSYAMRYPSRVRHLVLVDPWGFSIKPAVDAANSYLSLLISAFAARFNPLTPIRAAGPFGPSLMTRIRPDLTYIFGEPFMNYVYHCNAQEPSGESAFFYMQIPIGWAKRPMLERIGNNLDPGVPITMIYGLRSWMDSTAGHKVAELRPHSYVNLCHVQRAGHHVHADQPEKFNDLIRDVYSVVDDGLDSAPVDTRAGL